MALGALFRTRGPKMLPNTVPVARAVAASSAFPPVFTPLKIERVPSGVLRSLATWLLRRWARGATVSVVDGGVFDNQGTQMLLEEKCDRVIVSDAAAALRPDPSPSSWQFFPPRRGVFRRVSDVIYERARDLGYKRLAARQAVGQALAAARNWMPPNVFDQLRKAVEPVIESYAYVELRPVPRFRWQGGARLDERLIDAVARIRTDLDGFSPIEISALMFHGYTVIDHCLRAYRQDWLAELGGPLPDLDFRSAVEEINIPWAAMAPSEALVYLHHLRASQSRSWILRWLRRTLGDPLDPVGLFG